MGHGGSACAMWRWPQVGGAGRLDEPDAARPYPPHPSHPHAAGAARGRWAARVIMPRVPCKALLARGSRVAELARRSRPPVAPGPARRLRAATTSSPVEALGVLCARAPGRAWCGSCPRPYTNSSRASSSEETRLTPQQEHTAHPITDHRGVMRLGRTPRTPRTRTPQAQPADAGQLV